MAAAAATGSHNPRLQRKRQRGGDDDDRLHGGTGNDDIDGGDGTDIVIYASSDNAVRVDLRVEFAQDTGQGLDAISNVENVEGSFYNDTLIGNDFDNLLIGRDGGDQIFGENGDDTLEGGEGDDTLVGGGDNDTALYSSGTLSATVDLAISGTQDTGGFGLDQLFEIENLITGAGADFLGGDGNSNRLESGAGNDTLEDGPGSDRLWGGVGADVFVFAADGEADRIADFTPGEDIIRLSGIDGGFAGLDIAAVGGALRIAAAGDVLWLEGVGADVLTADDFLFL